MTDTQLRAGPSRPRQRRTDHSRSLKEAATAQWMRAVAALDDESDYVVSLRYADIDDPLDRLLIEATLEYEVLDDDYLATMMAFQDLKRAVTDWG